MAKSKERIKLTIASERRMHPPSTTFGKALHNWLVSKGVKTMEEAAELVGYSRHSVLLWRRGAREPSEQTERLMRGYFSGKLTPPGEITPPGAGANRRKK